MCRAWLCPILVLLCEASHLTAATYFLRVTRYRDAPRLDDAEVDRILLEAEQLLCRACGRPWPCDLVLRRLEPVQASPERAGLMSADVFRSLGRQDQILPVRRVYIVRGISSCDGEPGPLAGCAEPGGNTILVAPTAPPRGSDPASPTQNQARNAEWYQDQAQIWVHELGHNLGLCHQPGETSLLTCRPTRWSVWLHPGGCTAFRDYGDVGEAPRYPKPVFCPPCAETSRRREASP
jgi:hypothetical protein